MTDSTTTPPTTPPTTPHSTPPTTPASAPAAPPAPSLLESLSKSFEPSQVERRWSKNWEEIGLGKHGWRDSGEPSKAAAQEGKNFSIQIPPPNVTGTLHMGHAFNQTIMDSLTRYHRMRGFNTLWTPGSDHAGIATQIVVERQLKTQGVDYRKLGRAGFVEKVWEWKAQSGNTIKEQMIRLGASVDWSREYFTMDEQRSKAVNAAFVQLYKEGLIYRARRLINWDPALQTAVSDLEVDSQEEEGFLWHIAYPLTDGGQLVVATTRPETMLGDVAIMVHPDDERFAHLVGKNAVVPLCWRTIPIIADSYVDMSFGTGCVKVTPGHDANDFAVASRHELIPACIFDQNVQIRSLSMEEKGLARTDPAASREALILEHIPVRYRGLDRFSAREQIIHDLDALSLLVETKKHKLMVPRCTRSGQIVEPMLSNQWFVAMTKPSALKRDGKSIAQRAIDAVDSGAIRFVPENWVNTYNQWMDNIQDWCISRQLWWGHQIPAWYDETGQIFVAQDEQQAQRLAPGRKLMRDSDVLDTWFSSALLPFSTFGWPQVEDAANPLSDYNLYLPSSVLVTGYDIIFFWVARMIMMSLHFTSRIPFRQVYIHGLVLDSHGKKMSKSEGNVLDPVDLIDGIDLPALLEKRVLGLRQPETAPLVKKATEQEFPNGIPAFGADALRFTFAAYASLGRTINFDTKRCEGYRNFCNKLWNASRFVLMHCENNVCSTPIDGAHRSMADHWIVSLLQRAELAVSKAFEQYRLDQVATAIYDFVWNEYCDWYLEIAKVQIQQGSPEQKQSTRSTLIRVLEAVLRLAHPLIPFITEELWQVVAPVAEKKITASIALAPFPHPQLDSINPQAESFIADLKALVDECRALRGQLNVSPATRLPLYIHGADSDFSKEALPALQSLAKLSEVRLFDSESQWSQAAGAAPVAVKGAMRLALFMPVDIEAEKKRLTKELDRLKAEQAKAQSKLANTAFVSKAPAAVIEQERSRLEAFDQALEKIATQLTRLG